MQQNPPPPPPQPGAPNIAQQNLVTGQPQASSTNGTSISQPAQRYDYSTQNQQQQNKIAEQYYAGFVKQGGIVNQANAYKAQNANKWPPTIPFTTTPGQLTGGVGMQANRNIRPGSFANKPRRPPGNQQTFYCEICKVSCAGPQTYKEHLEGKNHKKKEKSQASKTEESETTNEENSGENSQSKVRGQSYSFNSRNNPKNVINCELCDVACTGIIF
jgi:hypothetical protein